MKINSPNAFSAQALGSILNVHYKTVTNWYSIYLRDGISCILRYTKSGTKRTVLTPNIVKFIEDTLNNPQNGICGYKELLHLVSKKVA